MPNSYACLILLIQLRNTKIDIALFSSNLIVRNVNNLQKFRSRRKKIFVCNIMFLVLSEPGI